MVRSGHLPYSLRALDKLEAFRVFCDVPLIVNQPGALRRGARSTKDVYEICLQTRGANRGWEYSYHLWCAFDISAPEIGNDELYELALEFRELGGWGGIGRYDTFIHCDDRDDLMGRVNLWDSRKNKS